MGLPTRVEPVRAPDSEFELAAVRRRERRTTDREYWRRGLLQSAPVPRPISTSPDPKRSLTIEQLLTWAYADQRVHKYLRRPIDWFLWALDDAGLAARADDRRPVHHDAALVHEAVMKAPEGLAHLVVDCSANGIIPEPCDALPMPGPIEPTDRFDLSDSYVVADGSRRRYQIRVAEVVTEVEIGWRPKGRGKMEQYETRRRRVEVEYCPIAWTPDPAYIAMTNEMAASWQAEMSRLHVELAAAGLRNHELLPM